MLPPLPAILFFFFFFNDTATTEIYTLSLHDALPISFGPGSLAGPTLDFPECMVLSYRRRLRGVVPSHRRGIKPWRSEEHTSELQSPCNLVCRLLLEKKKRF